MSPTSYQAAPPRESMIADAYRAVKRIQSVSNGSERIRAADYYHSLYGVLVFGEILLEEECTLQIPVEV